MGVFARIFGRSKVSEEASSSEPEAGTGAAEPAAEPSGPSGAEAEETAPAAAADSEGTGADDGVEIPKQQSADEAADSDAGEGARR
ncbi:hypothetical protein [Streptomyces sp. NPDC056628]|uniref:hypothetical protein n=1 Tax=Streptomyces sp. NPDC056628 TaxID=3345882 RepID=UPI0036C09B4B